MITFFLTVYIILGAAVILYIEKEDQCFFSQPASIESILSILLLTFTWPLAIPRLIIDYSNKQDDE